MEKIKAFGRYIRHISLWKKVLVSILVLVMIWFGYRNLTNGKQKTVQQQTAKVERGTIIATVSASGNVTSSNNAAVNTQATGAVKTIYAENGQYVQAGDPIAEIELDQESKQRYEQALSAYQSAQNNLMTAQNQKYTLQATMFEKWDTFKELAESDSYTNDDGSPNTTNRALPEFYIPQDEWLAAEAAYKNQEKVIAQTQTALNSAWYSLQQSSPVIYAPITGSVSGLTLQVGSVISSAGTSSNSSTITSQKIASVVTEASPMISVNLTEMDITKVEVGDKATLTFDAYPDKTFTGRVVSVDTIGSVNSGVTNYPTLIALDVQDIKILPNMSVTANIITSTKSNVLMVPISSVQSSDEGSYVTVLKNGKTQQVNVETGISSDTYIEIISGLSEGDTVVTATLSTTNMSTQGNRNASPFGGFGGGGAVRVIR